MLSSREGNPTTARMEEEMASEVGARAGEGEILLTVMLKHQKDKNLAEINAKLDAT